MNIINRRLPVYNEVNERACDFVCALQGGVKFVESTNGVRPKPDNLRNLRTSVLDVEL